MHTSNNETIVLLGAGRRYSFVERLQNHGFKVMSVEKEPDVPISKLCEVFHPEQFADFLEVAGSKNPLLIMPLCDAETINAEQYEKHIWVGSNADAAYKCYNKQLFDTFMIDHFPQYYPSVKAGKPVVIKPIFGAGSKGISYSEHSNIDVQPEYLKQRRVFGKEYSVDAYFNRNKEYVKGVARTRDRVSGGEVIDSETSELMTDRLEPIVELVGEKIGLVGPTCFQFMIEEGTGDPYLFEINARFGGGNILSLEAGLDMIALIRAEYRYGAAVKPDSQFTINWGLKMRRVNREIFFNA